MENNKSQNKQNKNIYNNKNLDENTNNILSNQTDVEVSIDTQSLLNQEQENKTVDATTNNLNTTNFDSINNDKNKSLNTLSNNNTSEPDLKYKNKKEVAKGGILGAFIGLAVIVPGVSGSAVAIIFKMYEKLLYAISNIFKKFKKCARFLLPIAIGVLLGFVLGFFGVRTLLNIIPFIVICLFAGLMFGAYPAVTDQIKGSKPSAKNICLFIAGLIIPILISVISIYGGVGNQSLNDLQFYHYIMFIVIGFLIAITQLVPGLSATALLMSFGYFTPLMNSVSLTYFSSNPAIFLVYACLIVGFVIGLFSVSKGLSKLINKHKIPTFYCIAGLSLGSFITMFFNPEVMDIYSSWAAGSGFLTDIIIGVIIFIVGVALSYLFVKYERKK